MRVPVSQHLAERCAIACENRAIHAGPLHCDRKFVRRRQSSQNCVDSDPASL